jgi:hypothetical protein
MAGEIFEAGFAVLPATACIRSRFRSASEETDQPRKVGLESFTFRNLFLRPIVGAQSEWRSMMERVIGFPRACASCSGRGL